MFSAVKSIWVSPMRSCPTNRFAGQAQLITNFSTFVVYVISYD